MDATTHHQNIVKRFKKKAHSKTSKSNKRRSQQESLKVVYISSPMKVKTSASKFRSIVQQLTGKDSDIERYLDDDTNKLGDFYEFGDFNNGADEAERVLATSSDETASPNSTGSGSFLGAIDEVFTSEEMEDIFCLNLFSDDISSCDDDKADVLGSYDDLLL